MKIIIGLFLMLQFYSSSSQGNGYTIRYKHEYLSLDLPDGTKPKMVVPAEFKAVLGDSFPIEEAFSVPLEMELIMKVDNNGNYCMKFWSNKPGISTKTSFYYYQDRKYFTKNDTSSMQALKLDFKKGSQTKKILQYECEQFNAYDSSGKSVYEIWATKDLPGSITGFHRLPNFGYAVLEITSLKGKWRRTVVDVRTQKKEEELVCN